MLPYLDHVGTVHLKGMGTVDIANDSSQIIQGPGNQGIYFRQGHWLCA